MNTMTAAANQVSRRAVAPRLEELSQAVLAYSQLTDQLRQSQDRLQQTVEQLRRELGHKNRLLERRNRLAALGEMAAGMAHEIRNPLGGIQLYASLLAKDLRHQPASAAMVDKISLCVRRLESLVGQVLGFTRDIHARCDEADLAGIIGDVLEAAEQALGQANVRTTVRGPRSLVVRVDGALMAQAILNLVLNAAEAMAADRSGRAACLRVEFEARSPDAQWDQFRLAITDSGPGIVPGDLEKIFDPFFTTKDHGTGLGLAIVHRIVDAHNGTITAANAPDGGAVFEIRL
jgi:signal transduction histidine kinase